MKRRNLFVALLAVLVLWVGVGWFIWPRHNKGPLLRLNVVRLTVENGRQTGFFQVEVADRRRIEIVEVDRITGDRIEGPLDFSDVKSARVAKKVPNFWAPSQSSPMGDPKKGRTEFGVIAPTNAPVWKLRVTVHMETPSQLERFKMMPGLWWNMRQNGSSIYGATKDTWNAFYSDSNQWIESEPMTNTVPVVPAM
jgi:hypothetical protein